MFMIWERRRTSFDSSKQATRYMEDARLSLCNPLKARVTVHAYIEHVGLCFQCHSSRLLNVAFL